MRDEGVGTLRLIVGSDGRIRVSERPPGVTVNDDRVRLDDDDPLRRATIEQLVQMARENRLNDEAEYQLLGWNLYDVLLGNQIGEALHRTMQDPNLKLLRVVLEFEDRQQQLASWPWEYLYCPEKLGKTGTGYFLSQRAKLVLIRNLPGPQTQVTVEQPPVRVLFVASRPAGMSLSYESVLETLKDLDSKHDTIHLEVIEPTKLDPDEDLEVSAATYRSVIAAAEVFEPHVIHIVAHGHREGDSSEIAFMATNGAPDWVDEEDLARDLMDLSFLRFVFLEACESAQAGYNTLREHHAAISGVAMRLAHAGIPAVVGMQYEVRQGAANVFARQLYTQLIECKPVDVAVMEARRRLDREERDAARITGGARRRLRPGFGLPVLYLTDTGALFPPDAVDLAAVETSSGPAGTRLPFPRPPADVKHADVPPPPENCARCGRALDPYDRYCAGCDNYLKCPKCGFPVREPRARCGNCLQSLQVDGVPLDPPTARRGQLPAAGEAGSFGR